MILLPIVLLSLGFPLSGSEAAPSVRIGQVAWIEGPGDGKPRRSRFLHRRVRCPGH